MQYTRRQLLARLAASSATACLPALAAPRGDQKGHALAAPEQIWAHLMAGNRRYAAGRTEDRHLVQVRRQLVSGQHPQAIVLTCADSRVAPELIFDQNLGDLFVVRTAGNVADPVALGSLEYAAEHLHTRLLIVLGHDHCGAVAAALAHGKMPTPNLEAIVAHIAPAVERVKQMPEGEAKARMASIENVHQSAADLLTHSPILRAEAAAGKLVVVQALYELASGEVKRL